VTVLYSCVGAGCMALAVAGAVLPVLPTVPFLLAAAWCFSRSSPEREQAILAHPRFGPTVAAWRLHGAISSRSKLAATATLALSLAVTAATAPGWATLAAGAAASGVLAFVWTRPTPARG